MDYEAKKELIAKVENDYGIDQLFKELMIPSVHKKGNTVYCVCPFHEGADNQNAFAYTLSTEDKVGFGYCFTHCHKKFSLFDIVMKSKSCDFIEAVQFLADLVGVSVNMSSKPKSSSDSYLNKQFVNQLRAVKSKKKKVEVKPLDIGIFNDFMPRMHKMLRNEGFDDEIREYFDLGVAISGYLEGRITIPIDYMDGTYITVSGRSTLSQEKLDELGQRRYQIWYDTDKGITLYNISRALPYIKAKGEVIVVEGFKSVWRLHQWGIDNAVAVMGNVATDEQLKILKKLGCKIIVCGDRDEAGTDLNEQIKTEMKMYANVEVLDMQLLAVPEKSSIDNITQEQFQFLMDNK